MDAANRGAILCPLNGDGMHTQTIKQSDSCSNGQVRITKEKIQSAQFSKKMVVKLTSYPDCRILLCCCAIVNNYGMNIRQASKCIFAGIEHVN
jgi:hypothetical protein